jgi:hypothetical protein
VALAANFIKEMLLRKRAMQAYRLRFVVGVKFISREEVVSNELRGAS